MDESASAGSQLPSEGCASGARHSLEHLEQLEDLRHEAILRELSVLHARSGSAGDYLDTLSQALGGWWAPAAELVKEEEGSPISLDSGGSSTDSEDESRRAAKFEAAAEVLEAQRHAAESLLDRVESRHRDLLHCLRSIRAQANIQTPADDASVDRSEAFDSRPRPAATPRPYPTVATPQAAAAAARRKVMAPSSSPAASPQRKSGSPRIRVAMSPRQAARNQRRLRRRAAAREEARRTEKRPTSSTVSSQHSTTSPPLGSVPNETRDFGTQASPPGTPLEISVDFAQSPPPRILPSPSETCAKGVEDLLAAVSQRRRRTQEHLAAVHTQADEAEREASRAAARATEITARKANTLQTVVQQRERLRLRLLECEARRDAELASTLEPERARVSARWETLISTTAEEAARTAEQLRTAVEKADACHSETAATNERLERQRAALKKEAASLSAELSSLRVRESELAALLASSPARSY
eukprot:Hpha_TRINITY_DN19049_c0_g1::TRINITY_DN19049_c0_g1_i1::g.138357::m.138357